MTLYANATFDGDPAKTIRFGCGLIDDVVDQLNPVEQERQRLLSEQEERQAASTAEVAAERRAEAEWQARRDGRVPRTPLEAAVEAHAAQDRLDRQQAARERQLEAEGGTPRRLPSIVAKENAAAEAEFMSQPADVALVSHMVAEVEEQTNRKLAKLASTVARVLGKG
jgi:hypothetical protein